MKKLNTYDIYQFAINVHPLAGISYKEGMKIHEIFFDLVKAFSALELQVDRRTLFSASIKRSAGALMRAISSLGATSDKPGGLWDADPSDLVNQYQLRTIIQAAKDFETVLSNEMPGLAIYFVSTKGIYSTDDLISHAELHIPESLRKVVTSKAVEDIQQAGKCLAYEVSTASAFHMWRAVETVMSSYYEYLTKGRTFEGDKIQRNWASYIQALNNEGADN